MIKRSPSTHRFNEVFKEFKKLTDQDPGAAIAAARLLTPDANLDQNQINELAAMTLIDAGVACRDKLAVDEGVAILERQLEAFPTRNDLGYCLANGLSALADLGKIPSPDLDPDWYLRTADARRRARNLYLIAALDPSMPPHLAAQSYTNLANSLFVAYRFIEAYDYFLKAIDLDSTNGVALTGAARALIRLTQIGSADSLVLQTVAANYLSKAKQNPDRIRELVGEAGYQSLLKFMDTKMPIGRMPDLSKADDYQKFVAIHRLSLSPTIEGLDLSLARWDSLTLGSITEDINSSDGVPPIFAIFNLLKAEFLSVRFVAFFALQNALPESGKYADTLDYARYGIQPSMLTLAQRACLDLLDKVAIATSDYLALPGDPFYISFRNRWFKKRGKNEPLQWDDSVRDEIYLKNTDLIAISEASGDIDDGGFLHDKRAMRNSSTHRFTVLHDIGASPSRDNKFIDHFSEKAFINQLIETLQLTRAVILYFVYMVRRHEKRIKNTDRIQAPIIIPDHDWIRGESDS